MMLRLQDLPLDERHRRAEVLFSRGMYSLAREKYEALRDELVDRGPEVEFAIRWRLAVCCAALGATEEADRTIGEALMIEAELYFVQQMPAIPIYSYRNPHLVAQGLEGYENNLSGIFDPARLRWAGR